MLSATASRVSPTLIRALSMLLKNPFLKTTKRKKIGKKEKYETNRNREDGVLMSEDERKLKKVNRKMMVTTMLHYIISYDIL